MTKIWVKNSHYGKSWLRFIVSIYPLKHDTYGEAGGFKGNLGEWEVCHCPSTFVVMADDAMPGETFRGIQ